MEIFSLESLFTALVTSISIREYALPFLVPGVECSDAELLRAFTLEEAADFANFYFTWYVIMTELGETCVRITNILKIIFSRDQNIQGAQRGIPTGFNFQFIISEFGYRFLLIMPDVIGLVYQFWETYFRLSSALLKWSEEERSACFLERLDMATEFRPPLFTILRWAPCILTKNCGGK